MRTRGLIAFLSLAGVLLAGGCPQEPSDPNNLPNQQLTEAQRAATDFVVQQVAAAAAGLNALTTIADARLNPESLPASGAFGQCPAVSITTIGNNSEVTLDFGAGCGGPATGGRLAQGSLALGIVRSTRAVRAEFDNFRINGRAVTGRIDGTLVRTSSGVTLDGTCSITTRTVGTASGTLTVDFETGGRVTIREANLLFDNNLQSNAVVLTNVVSDPATNGNFVPQSGTARFVVASSAPGPQQLTLIVTFTNETPVNGAVRVQVQSQQPITYQVPGIPG